MKKNSIYDLIGIHSDLLKHEIKKNIEHNSYTASENTYQMKSSKLKIYF
jgi:hypothetical protein